jgi:hypothetical protein
MRRRKFLASISAPLILVKSGAGFMGQVQPVPQTGRIKHGVTRGVFPNWSLEDCCRQAAQLGVKGFDFIDNPADWPLLKKYGLTLSMYRLDFGGGRSEGRAPQAPPGWNAVALKEAQGDYLMAMHAAIDRTEENGIPNILLQAGSRSASLSYEQGADNAVAFCS